MNIQARRVWPLAAWIVLVLLVSLLPLPFKQLLETHGRFHNTAHFLAFLITVLVFCRKRWSNASITGACAGAIIMAFLTEGAQTAIYHNLFEWDDVLIDSLGAIIGGALLLATAPTPSPAGRK